MAKRGPYRKRGSAVVVVKKRAGQASKIRQGPKDPVSNARQLHERIQQIVLSDSWTHSDIDGDCYMGSGPGIVYLKLTFTELKDSMSKLAKVHMDRAQKIVTDILEPFGATMREPFSEHNWVIFVIIPYNVKISDVPGYKKSNGHSELSTVYKKKETALIRHEKAVIKQDFDAEEDPKPEPALSEA